MAHELNASEQNNTWTLQPLPARKTTIGYQWLFRTKFLTDGSLDNYKSRLVARGSTQTLGLDYFETFVPVANMSTVRILIALAALKN